MDPTRVLCDRCGRASDRPRAAALRPVGMIGWVWLIVILTGPILLLWLAMSRTSRMRWIVAAALVGEAAIAGVLIDFLPRGFFEVALGVLILGVATVATGRLIDRRRLGPAGQTRVRVARHLLVGWALTALMCGGVVLKPGPFFPETDEVLPLPDGLHATVAPTDRGGCGSGVCSRTITVTGRPGQANDDLYAEIKRHVKARGWGSQCRPVGWLLVRTTECVELAARDGQVTIFLSGNRDDVRDMATID
jgi:hypothetical protein